MPTTMRPRLITTAVAGLTLTFIGLSAGPALAATNLAPPPSVDASGHNHYGNGDTTVATVDGLEPNTEYYIGQCETASYPLGIPACTGFQSKTTDDSGALTAEIVLVSGGDNVHKNAPGQPAEVDCKANEACEITVATHGRQKSIVDRSVSFRVDE